jgi:hypothetical protein
MNPQQPPYGHFPNPYAGMSPQMLQMQQYQAAMLLQQQQRMPFAFQPLYNHSSMMSMQHPMRHQGYMHPNQGQARQAQYPQAPQGHQALQAQQGPQGPQGPQGSQGQQALQSGETEIEIIQSEDVDHVAEALQTNPQFLRTVDESAVKTSEPNVFQIDQEMYPLAAWKRIDARVASNQQFKQWFNYGMAPRTFAAYAAQQRTVQKNLVEAIAKSNHCL